jgi:hypothetical protein
VENNAQDPVPKRNTGLLRGLTILFAVAIIGVILFFGGKFIYSLGQTASLEISGVDLTPHASASPVLQFTSTITPTFTPAPTSTFLFPPTPTSTKIPWTSCPGIVVTMEDTSDGDFLHVLRCEDGLEYKVGPLSKGVYAVSPNDQYLVYADINGILYAARIGSPALTIIRKTQHEFFVFSKKVDPIFEFTFSGEPPYVLELYEKRYEQNMPIDMPGWLSE